MSMQHTNGPRRGPWVRLQSDYHYDPAIMKVGTHAELIFIRMLSGAAIAATNGLLEYHQIRALCHGMRKLGEGLKLLCDHGLIELVPPSGQDRVELGSDLGSASGQVKVRSGQDRVELGSSYGQDRVKYLIKNWLKYNPSFEDVSAGREQDRIRQAEYRSSKKADVSRDNDTKEVKDLLEEQSRSLTDEHKNARMTSAAPPPPSGGAAAAPPLPSAFQDLKVNPNPEDQKPKIKSVKPQRGMGVTGPDGTFYPYDQHREMSYASLPPGTTRAPCISSKPIVPTPPPGSPAALNPKMMEVDGAMIPIPAWTDEPVTATPPKERSPETEELIRKTRQKLAALQTSNAKRTYESMRRGQSPTRVDPTEPEDDPLAQSVFKGLGR